MARAIFITGASSGIGEALSLRYASEARKGEVVLGLVSRGRDGALDAVAAACRARGAIVHRYAVDVSDAAAMKTAAHDFVARAGGIDLVIANAGVAVVDGHDDDPLSAARTNMDVNYFGVINTITPFLASMHANRKGALAIISSISALRATHNSGPYSASKAAINLWAEGLRLRLRPSGISITTLGVGFVDTAMTRDNPFWMPGLISADKASCLIAGKIRRKTRHTVLPWTSGGLWTLFSLMPGRFYDWLIDTVKKRQ